MAFPFLPFTGFFTPRLLHRDHVAKAMQTSRAAICSEHIHRSFLACGIELVEADSELVTPNDLGRSVATRYVGTLMG
jgi:hypothetical protein